MWHDFISFVFQSVRVGNLSSFGEIQTKFADVFKQDVWSFVLMLKLIPGVSRLTEMFNINLQKPKSVKFFKDIVTQTLKQRSETGERRNDMIDMMLDIMNKKDKEEMEGDMDQYHRDMRFSHKKTKKPDRARRYFKSDNSFDGRL